MLLYHLAHFLVAGHHYPAHTLALGRDIAACCVLLLGCVEESVPRINVSVVGTSPELAERMVEPARLHSVGNRAESAC